MGESTDQAKSLNYSALAWKQLHNVVLFVEIVN
jgi:hypothetical protein